MKALYKIPLFEDVETCVPVVENSPRSQRFHPIPYFRGGEPWLAVLSAAPRPNQKRVPELDLSPNERSSIRSWFCSLIDLAFVDHELSHIYFELHPLFSEEPPPLMWILPIRQSIEQAQSESGSVSILGVKFVPEWGDLRAIGSRDTQRMNEKYPLNTPLTHAEQKELLGVMARQLR